MDALTGTWTYRSFINNPASVTSGDEALALIFGEGVLEIEVASVAEGFRATLSFGGNAVMDLNGTVVGAQGAAPQTVAAQGRGRPASPISDFAYDYLFYCVPAWPEGINQRDALVGTVVRAEDHGSAKKGATASTITVRRDG